MLTKLGINTVRAEKVGPNVKEGINHSTHAKIVKCTCGKSFEKNCPSEAACDVSSFECPNCGNRIQ